ncbi:hypothetical protein MNBD_GAMMA08-2358 [hydrothermal vent metagenome]|uniref:Uncharacterized protein n=1 Tax=hydrothermal vent metagenome TaxID=652676 RepID=A0A3B0YFI1_9ZZZZ
MMDSLSYLTSSPQRILLAFLTIISINGCAGKPALFNEEDSGLSTLDTDEIVYKVFFDREGNIYPDRKGENSIEIVTNDFTDGSKNGYLQRYFCDNPEQLNSVALQAGIKNNITNTCMISDDAEEGFSGAIKYGNSLSQDNWLDQWDVIQNGLLNKHSLILAELLQREENLDHQLFILIHGYNNSSDAIKDNYNDVRNALRKNDKYKDMKFIFLDVYWDGFIQPLPVNIWGPAQYTGPVVGIKLRKLLKEVKPARSVRILTHSSGAFVAGSLVGDSRKALGLWEKKNICTKGHINYDQATCQYKQVMTSNDSMCEIDDYEIIKSNDVRLGMIAPATSAWTFTGGEWSGIEDGRGILKPSGTLRLIAGQHEDDFANTKLIGLEDKKGATTLGVRKSSFCEIQAHVAKSEILKKYVDVHRVEFSTEGEEPYPYYFFRADHALYAYLNRKKATEFWALFLETDTVPNTKENRSDNNCINAIEEAYSDDDDFL